MKKTYQKPNVKVSEIETEELLTASGDGPSIGGNTGIVIGEGEPPSSGNAKVNNFFGSGSDDSGAEIDWE